MTRVTMSQFLENPERYELRKGDTPGAPLCPYGNNYSWIGYDLEDQTYVRFSKSVFKKLYQLTLKMSEEDSRIIQS